MMTWQSAFATAPPRFYHWHRVNDQEARTGVAVEPWEMFDGARELPSAAAVPTAAGWAAAVDGAQRAADHADRGDDDAEMRWTDRAFALLRQYAACVAAEFMTEDVRAWAHQEHGLPLPPDGRAWGQVIMRARRAGLLERLRYEPMKSANCHADPKSVWRWTG